MKTIKLQKKKQFQVNKNRTLIRKQNESSEEITQNERKQKWENIIKEDVDLGNLFGLASSDKFYVTGLNLHGTKSEILLH